MAKKKQSSSRKPSKIGRPKPSSPKTGLHRGRYDDGGKLK